MQRLLSHDSMAYGRARKQALHNIFPAIFDAPAYHAAEMRWAFAHLRRQSPPRAHYFTQYFLREMSHSRLLALSACIVAPVTSRLDAGIRLPQTLLSRDFIPARRRMMILFTPL